MTTQTAKRNLCCISND